MEPLIFAGGSSFHSTFRSGDLPDLTEREIPQASQVIGAIAHQWRQPLNALALNLQTLQMRKSFSREEMEEVIEQALRQIEFLSTTTSDFQGLFLTGNTPMPFEMGRLCRETARLLEPFRRKEEVTFFFPEEKESALAAPGEIRQALLIFFNNSMDAIRLRRQTERSLRGEIRMELFPAKETVRLEVRDNGGGFPEEVLRRLFVPGVSTKGGSHRGMGLPLARMIVEKAGGEIRVENGHAEARVSITLPRWS